MPKKIHSRTFKNIGSIISTVGSLKLSTVFLYKKTCDIR